MLRKNSIRDKVTTNGGSRGYSHMVQSKIAKRRNEDGKLEGKVVTRERERMMQRLGYDPGPNTVARHVKPGAHHSDKNEAYYMGTRADNTAESNRLRAKRFKEKISK